MIDELRVNQTFNLRVQSAFFIYMRLRSFAVNN
jgi:hypothetical protein